MKKFVFLILFSAGTLMAQTGTLTKAAASEVVRKINERMLNSKHFSAKLEYTIYKNHADSQALEKSEGYYRRSGKKEHSMLLGTETIQNEDERLVIDSANRNVVLSAPKLKPLLIEESMQAALAMCHKITLVRKDGYCIMTFLPDERSGAGFSRMEIAYSEDTYFISSLSMYYIHTPMPGFDDITDPKVVIRYSDVSTSHIAGNEFHTGSYLEKKQNEYVLRAHMKNYTFFNQIKANN